MWKYDNCLQRRKKNSNYAESMITYRKGDVLTSKIFPNFRATVTQDIRGRGRMQFSMNPFANEDQHNTLH